MSDSLQNVDNEIAIIETNISINNLYNTFLSKFDTKTYDDIVNTSDVIFERYKSLLNLDYIEAISQTHDFLTTNAKFTGSDGNQVNLEQNIRIGSSTTPPYSLNILFEVNLSNFFSKKLKIYNVYFDFLIQFHKQIHELIVNDHILDEKIYYENEFTYKMKYLLSEDKPYTVNDKEFFIKDESKILKFRLNKNNIESKNIIQDLIIVTQYDDENVKNAFDNMLYNIDKSDLLKHIDLVNTTELWKKNKYSYI